MGDAVLPSTGVVYGELRIVLPFREGVGGDVGGVAATLLVGVDDVADSWLVGLEKAWCCKAIAALSGEKSPLGGEEAILDPDRSFKWGASPLGKENVPLGVKNPECVP